MLESKFFKTGLKIIMVLVIILLGMKVAPILKPLYEVVSLFIIPLIFAMFIYYVLRPVVEFIQKFVKKRWIAVAMTLILVISLFVFVFGYGGTQIATEIKSLFEELRKVLDDIIKNDSIKWPFEEFIPFEEITKKVTEFFKDGLTKIVPNVASGATGVVGTIGSFGTKLFLTLFMLLFFLKDGTSIVDGIVGVIPVKHREKAQSLRKKIDETLAIYISGQIMVSLILGVLTLIGYSVIGLKNAFALSVINLLFNLIPYVGPILGFIPALIMALSGGMTMIVLVIVVAVIVQQLEGNLVSPWVIGDKLQIHPLTVVVVITAAISQAGIIGAFVAIPVYSIIRVILNEIKENKKGSKKEADDEIIL